MWGYNTTHGIMTLSLCLNILRSNLKLSAQNSDTGNNFIFHHDNDPKHTAFNVHLCCLYDCPQVLNTPLQSPDLNPIVQIWKELVVRILNTTSKR